MISLLLLALSFLGAAIFAFRLWQSLRQTPLLLPNSQASDRHQIPTTTIIIPAYNEAENIEECITSVLESSTLSADCLEVWVVDDESTDETVAIVQSLQSRRKDPRLHLLLGKPRPEGETWVGKSWACVQGAESTKGDFLLFIDADVRFELGAIEAAVRTAEQESIDLLTCGPAIVCGCLAEWIVQPLMFSTILIGFNADAVNDPKSDKAFAAGPFMLFRRSAYDRIGGHRAVGDQVVEDVALAGLIKRSGFSLRLLSGIRLVSVRMYRSGSALWEGWTKNLFLGTGRQWAGTLLYAALMPLIFTVPWLVLLAFLNRSFFVPLSVYEGLAIALALGTIGIQFLMRVVMLKASGFPLRYWWLSGIGGVFVAAIALASVIKTETGWGWTWRGRSLKQN